MKKQKISFKLMTDSLSRSEMKKILAGVGGSGCSNTSCKTRYDCGSGCSRCVELDRIGSGKACF